MRILAFVHGYPPTHNAGAEWMLHAMMLDLRTRGHEVRVVQARRHPGVWDGVPVQRTGPDRWMRRAVAWADVVLTHLDRARDAVSLARAEGRPVVWIAHSDLQMPPPGTNLVVHNSAWVRASLGVAGPVVHPPVRVADYATDPGDLVTMVYASADKGRGTLAAVAAASPSRRFLNVLGSYGAQEPVGLPNVETLPTTARMRDEVYARTRVLLAPSAYESWGRVAVEAMCSGIPVIAHPTPGLQEALGSAGIFADRDDHAAWLAALDKLDDPHMYASASSAARARAVELEQIVDAQMAELDAHLRDLVAGWSPARLTEGMADMPGLRKYIVTVHGVETTMKLSPADVDLYPGAVPVGDPMAQSGPVLHESAAPDLASKPATKARRAPNKARTPRTKKQQ